MGYNSADGAALVAAAVQAAIHGGAPRRTVAAVAAAVAGTVMSASAAPRQPATKPQVHSQDARNDALEADSPEQLLTSLRAARRAQRLRKKQRRREAKQAAGPSQSHNEDVVTSTVPAEVPSTDGAAGQRTEHVGALVAAPAQAPRPLAASAPVAQPRGQDSRKDKPIRSRSRHDADDLKDQRSRSSIGDSDADALSMMGLKSHYYKTSDVASSGMPSRGRPAATGSVHTTPPYDPGIPGRR